MMQEKKTPNISLNIKQVIYDALVLLLFFFFKSNIAVIF